MKHKALKGNGNFYEILFRCAVIGMVNNAFSTKRVKLSAMLFKVKAGRRQQKQFICNCSHFVQVDIHCERSEWEDTGVAIAKALGLQVHAMQKASAMHRSQTCLLKRLPSTTIVKVFCHLPQQLSRSF